MALSIMVMWIADTIVGQLTPVLLKSIGTAATFWVFATFCVIALVIVYKLLPETKGKTLEEIESDWKNRAVKKEALVFKKINFIFYKSLYQFRFDVPQVVDAVKC